MKPRPINFNAEMIHALLDGRKTQTRRKRTQHIGQIETKCHYGAVGSRLYVTEVFAQDGEKIVYKADNPTAKLGWIAPRFMRPETSRLSLKITGLSIERVQDISTQDAISEGLIHVDNSDICIADLWRSSKKGICFPNPIEAYAQFWDSCADPVDKWDLNPLVWVIKFKVRQRPQ